MALACILFYLGGLAGAICTVALALIVSKIISNRLSLLRFRKLSKGLPMLGDASLLGNHISTFSLGKENCRKLLEAHERQGAHVGGLIGDTPFVSSVDLNLLKRIIVDEAQLHPDRASLALPLREIEESMILLPGARSKPVRRVVGQALKPNNFKAPNVVREIEDSIERLVGHIERKLSVKAPAIIDKSQSSPPPPPPPPFIADDFAHKYSLDVVFSCFYKQYNLIDFDDPADTWTGLANSMVHNFQTNPLVRLSMIFPWFRRVVDWLTWHFHEQGVARQKILEFVKRQTRLGVEARREIKKREALGKSIGDASSFRLRDGTRFSRNIIDGVIDAFLEGKLRASDYFNTSCLMMLAADRTVTDCTVHTLYQLCVNQHVQARLRESIKAEGADSEYLAWVLLESLRLLPPAPGGCSRTVSRSIELPDGHVVPEGTFVIANAFAIHRLKEYWGEDAHEFRPERWRDTSQHHPMQFLAFGAGQRSCPGREFALFEMKMLFAALLMRYEFHGEPRDDIYKFDAPVLLFPLPYSHTSVAIRRLDHGDSLET